ncbi:MAG: DUF4065 domain-containing protein [Dyadobacter sp.]|uniref:Panacea domain-containing protein n=1 Tax=Dyadobacter sp. TaxID=1914288 RepID=UPI001B2B441B|nr:type II toxin-antitoxin system antitoxin SocA domain-containing protein [Dyadobacter sp.]MBO9614849.1 DUF4065 domain-containing protein [Dyadobacter sp.]
MKIGFGGRCFPSPTISASRSRRPACRLLHRIFQCNRQSDHPYEAPKLVFYTQAWHIAVFDKPIFEEDFQAWIHGPVLPSLYERYKSFQWRPIQRNDLDEVSLQALQGSFSSSIQEILIDVISEYFHKDAFALEQSTYAEVPWQIAKGKLAADEACTNVIEKTTIHDYYSLFVKSDGQEFQSSQGRQTHQAH